MAHHANVNHNGQHAVEGHAGSEKDKKAAINMLPNADLSVHTCDSCNKDITGVRVRRKHRERDGEKREEACQNVVFGR